MLLEDTAGQMVLTISSSGGKESGEERDSMGSLRQKVFTIRLENLQGLLLIKSPQIPSPYFAEFKRAF